MLTINDIIEAHKNREGPLLPILRDIQAARGCIDEHSIVEVAAGLNLTRAEVHGVVSFYDDFKSKPHQGASLRVCRAEACQARGCEALVRDAEAMIGKAMNLEPVYCLGLCSVGPAAIAGNGDVHARLTADKLVELVKANE